jgi:hypothetical protein
MNPREFGHLVFALSQMSALKKREWIRTALEEYRLTADQEARLRKMQSQCLDAIEKIEVEKFYQER